MKLAGLILALISMFSGCAYVNPLIQDFNVISVEQEKVLGDQVAGEIRKEMRIVSNPGLNLRVRRLGKLLENALLPHPFDYQFYVVQDKTPNAFSIPGGGIYVHTGLLCFVDDDNQPAGVLAHKIGHMYERHPTQSLLCAYGIEQLSGLIFRDNKNQFRTITFQLAGGGFLMQYGREDELEADALAYQLLRRLGMPTNGLRRFLIKLNNLYGSGHSIPFMSTHPPTPERINRLEIMERIGGQVISQPARSI